MISGVVLGFKFLLKLSSFIPIEILGPSIFAVTPNLTSFFLSDLFGLSKYSGLNKSKFIKVKPIKQKEDKNFTTVYYNSVCNLVEDIYKKIINLNKENEIEILSKYKNGNVIKIHDFNSMYFVR